MPVTNYHTVNGRLIGETTSGVRTDYLTDALGSITATVNESAQIINTYRYKPFGERLAKTGSGADPRFQFTGDTGSVTTSRRYAENYNRRRSLDVKNGRWGSVDPLWPIESAYSWVLANPVTHVDPSGTQLSGNPVLDPPRWPSVEPVPRPAPNPLINPGLVPPRPIPPTTGPLIIVGGAIAIIDLVNYICTGQTGPFTYIGEVIGEFMYGDTKEDYPGIEECKHNPPRTPEMAEAFRDLLLEQFYPLGCTKPPKRGVVTLSDKCIGGWHQTNTQRCTFARKGKRYTKPIAASILCCPCISPRGAVIFDCKATLPHESGK